MHAYAEPKQALVATLMLSAPLVLLLGAVLGVLWMLFVEVQDRLRVSKNRPSITIILDSITWPLQLFKLGPFRKGHDVDSVLSDALKNANKLTSFHLEGIEGKGKKTPETQFLEVKKLNRELGIKKSGTVFSPLGHIIIQQNTTRQLELRLKFMEYIRKHPAVAAAPMKRDPVFVIGFPRTGTTFLHELLGLHEEVCQHHTWEQFDPTPGTDSEKVVDLQADRAVKYKKNKLYFDWVVHPLIGDAIQYVHRIGYDEAEECTIPCGLFDMYVIASRDDTSSQPDI